MQNSNQATSKQPPFILPLLLWARKITRDAFLIAALDIDLAVLPVRVILVTRALPITLPKKELHNIELSNCPGPIVESDGIDIVVISEDGQVQGQTLDNKAIAFLLKPSGRDTLLRARDVIHRGLELRAVKVNRDAAL